MQTFIYAFLFSTIMVTPSELHFESVIGPRLYDGRRRIHHGHGAHRTSPHNHHNLHVRSRDTDKPSDDNTDNSVQVSK
jgi:hypothetical protein